MLKNKIKNMKIKKIKEAMRNYTDFFGRTLLEYSEIDKAKTIEDLQKIIDNHDMHLEHSCNDAQHSLRRFANSINL